MYQCVSGARVRRYWPAVGPQLTLYVPGPVLRAGTNDLVLLEMEGVPDELSGESMITTSVLLFATTPWLPCRSVY